MNIPIKQIPDQYTVAVHAMEQPQFVIGPLPLDRDHHDVLGHIRSALIAALNALAVMGLVIGAFLLINLAVMFAWPSYSRYVEQAGWYVGERIAAVMDELAGDDE